jgi:hypothetical protein
MSVRHVILRRDDVINELGKRERHVALSACLSNIHQGQIPSKESILLGLISTAVNSTVKVVCEGLKVSHPPEIGRHWPFDQAWNISILTGAMNV